MARPSPPPAKSGPGRIERALIDIASEQLSTGEIPSFRRTDEGRWEYCFSPLPSAMTHGALGILDPLSSIFQAHALEGAAGDRSSVVGRMAVWIRRRIRRFLAWQQRTDGTWRFYGHGSPLPSDLETTACAAAALLDGSDNPAVPSLASAGALRGFIRENGLFRSPGSRGDDAAPDQWRTRAANAHLLRCLILAGANGHALGLSLAADCDRGEENAATSLPTWHAIGRLCQSSRLDVLEGVAERAVQRLVSQGPHSRERFMSPLASGLWLTVLLDFCCETPIPAAADVVAQWLEMPMRQRNDAVLDPRASSPGLTTAIGLAALARASAAVEVS